ncbi:MAG TPA: hypothetical protein VF782_13285 [Allosphingosinicella sp.]|jgi:hypothetical protein
MNNWPAEVFGVEKESGSLLFFPVAAKEAGYILLPLVEIDPEDIINALSEDFGIRIEYVYLANIKIDLKKKPRACVSYESTNFVTMHKSHFLSEIASGGYLEAVFVSEAILLLMLGGDESWIVINSKQYRETSSKLNHLIMLSKNNIKVLGIEDQFDRF